MVGGRGGGERSKMAELPKLEPITGVHNQLAGASRHLVQPAQIMLVDRQIFLFLNDQCLNGTLIKNKRKFPHI
jgi:hypothetical protein